MPFNTSQFARERAFPNRTAQQRRRAVSGTK
jgi:hypothetical protein